MAEYIAKERVIEEIKGMDNCGCITRSVNHVCEDIRSIPTADVVERSKIDKAIEEIKQMLYVDSLIFGELCDFKDEKISADDVIEEFNRVTRIEVLRILERNIGE